MPTALKDEDVGLDPQELSDTQVGLSPTELSDSDVGLAPPVTQVNSLAPSFDMGWTGRQPAPAEQPAPSIPRLVNINDTLIRDASGQGPESPPAFDPMALPPAFDPDQAAQQEQELSKGLFTRAGIGPEKMPTGQELIAAVGGEATPASKLAAYGVSGAAKTITGIGDWMTSPVGFPQLVAAAIPGLDMVMAAKFAKDMIQGGYVAAKDVGVGLAEGDWQKVSEGVVNYAASVLGTKAVTTHGVKTAAERFNKFKEGVVPGSVQMPQIENQTEAQQRAQLIDEVNARTKPGEEIKPVAPVKPEVAELGTNPTDKDKLGNPTGTKYHATPEHWAEIKALEAVPKPYFNEAGEYIGESEKLAARKRIEEIKNQYYGSTMPVAPKEVGPDSTVDKALDNFIKDPTLKSPDDPNPGYGIGRQLTTIDQLEKILKRRDEVLSQDPHDRKSHGQFLKEAIDVATQSGTAKPRAGTMMDIPGGKPELIGHVADRNSPLDYQKNREVAQWLSKNAGRLTSDKDEIAHLKANAESLNKPSAPDPPEKFPNTGVGSPADEFGAIHGPVLSPEQISRFTEQEGESFPLESPPGTSAVLKVKRNKLWLETWRQIGNTSEHEAGVAYLHIRADGTTILDASKHGRPIDKLAADKLMEFLQKSAPLKPATPTPPKSLGDAPIAPAAEPSPAEKAVPAVAALTADDLQEIKAHYGITDEALRKATSTDDFPYTQAMMDAHDKQTLKATLARMIREAKVKPTAAETKTKPVSPQKDSMAFDKLVMDHAAERGWARNPDALYTETSGGGQQGTASIKARIAKGAELKIARRNAAIDAGIDPNTIDTTAGRAAALAALKEHVEGNYGEDYSLGTPETVEEQKARLARESAKPKPVQPANERLRGQPGSAGQGNLFSQPGQQEIFQPGPGGKTASSTDEAGSQLSQLAQSLPPLPGGSPAIPPLAGRLGDAFKAAGDTIRSSWNKLKTFLRGEPTSTSHTEAIGEWSLQRQESTRDAYKAWQKIKARIPDVEKRGAIAVWADAGGDAALLQQAAATLPEKYARIYRKALALTPDEINVSKNIRQYFDRRLQDAIDAGILADGVENYIRRLYEKPSDWKNAVLSELQYLSTGKPGFAKQRIFQYDFEAIGKGYRPILDFAARVLEYDQSLNHAIADRAFVKAEMGLKMKDGRPRIDVGGSGVQLPAGQTPPDTILIKPSFKPTDTENPLNNRSDYRPFNHPAFRKWKWVTEDSNGRPIFVQGDVLVHPDALPEMKRLLERSRIREHPAGRALLKTSDTIKQTMLDLSGFHPVQIGIHALEHRTLPLKDIDLKDETQRGLVRGGLVISSDRGFTDWSEGLHGTSLTRHIPLLGPKLVDFHDWMFRDWIPTVKMNMALNALERNRKLYPKLSEFNLNKLTAEQANAAFGGLNYKLLGRSQTMQDFLRLTLLAPDFLEARGRFAGQAFKGYGREQLTALLFGAATLYVTSRILNQLVDGNPHFEKENAFSVIHNGHAYGLRTVQGDILHLMSKPGQFWYHRLNPATTRFLMELVSGRNYFGQSRDPGQQALDEIKTVVPISLKGLTEGRSETLTESALNAFGLTTRRYTAIGQVHQLADAWKKKNHVRQEPGEFIFDPAKDPLYPLKQTLQFNDTQAAASEIAKVIKSGAYDERKLGQYFKRYARSGFTGSRANDQKFSASLNPYQKDLLTKARQEKEKLVEKFEAALALSR